MKNLKFAVIAATLVMFSLVSVKADAAGVGSIDYTRVQENYPAAIQAVKEIENKELEIQQFMIDKEKQYKTLDTPLKRQNFEDVTARELKSKQESFMTLKASKEEQIYKKIQAAAKAVMVEQKLDAIVSDRVIFVGGLDVTDLVIQKLKSGQF